MSVVKQLTDVCIFTILGIIISCVFDIFRTLRKRQKKNSIYTVMLQDVVFFFIVTIIIIIYTINVLTTDVRMYMLFGIIIGILIQRKYISKILIKIYNGIFSAVSEIIKFLCVPLELVFKLICKIIKKIFEKCCKFFSLMINFKCRVLTILRMTKISKKSRGLYYEKSKRSKKKCSKKEEKIS